MEVYLKIQSKIISQIYVFSVVAAAILFNLFIWLFPNRIITSYSSIPVNLYGYCDVYLLILFIFAVYFSIGADFNTSMEDITMASSRWKHNQYLFKKFFYLLAVYTPIYFITYISVYFKYVSVLSNDKVPMPLNELIIYSLITNVFIISLALFLLFLIKEVTISSVLIVSYYLIEEFLWRTKVFQQKGILNHIYYYDEMSYSRVMSSKLIYLLLAIVLFYLSLKLSMRKHRGFNS